MSQYSCHRLWGPVGVTPAGPLLNLPSKPLCHFLPIYPKFYPLLESFSAHFTDKEKRGIKKPHLQPKITHQQRTSMEA